MRRRGQRPRGGESMVRRVYGHLGEVRHRAEVVEYRIEQHAAKLGDRLPGAAICDRQRHRGGRLPAFACN